MEVESIKDRIQDAVTKSFRDSMKLSLDEMDTVEACDEAIEALHSEKAREAAYIAGNTVVINLYKEYGPTEKHLVKAAVAELNRGV